MSCQGGFVRASKGRYIEIDAEELDALRTAEDRALTIDAFVPAVAIDPIYLDGRMYYLSPAGSVAREPYAVLVQALARQERWGVGQVILSGKQQVAIVRPYRDALQMALLNYAAEIRDPADMIAAPAPVSGADKRIKLAEQLIANLSESHFDISKYHDTYFEKEKALVEAKAQGRKLVIPEVEEQPEVINLMEALKKSLGKTAEGRQGPPRPMRAASHRVRHPHKKPTGQRRRAS